ncbi:hypothetical protein M6B24_06160 [Enterobacter bugandensis]|nr:hypothetical protein [Enterobacter bugandensis]
MSTITKERIELFIKNPLENGLTRGEQMELARIALASLEAEAVAYVDPIAFHNFSVYRSGETDNKRMGREWMWANPDAGLIPVYTAPTAPVSVPDAATAIRACMEEFPESVHDIVEECAAIAESVCRAAMLQGAESAESPAGINQGKTETVTTACKLRDAVETIRNSGIAIDAEKIFAERDALNAPDCWCLTCRPVTMTDMRFVVCPECGNKRCPHANDHRNACTGSNELGQEGSAYPAAPQQEVK